jgi:hypothetical protein
MDNIGPEILNDLVQPLSSRNNNAHFGVRRQRNGFEAFDANRSANHFRIMVAIAGTTDDKFVAARLELFAKALDRNGNTVYFREKGISKNSNPHSLYFVI